MNPFNALADPNEPVDPTDVEFFKFSSLVADAKVSVQDGSFEKSNYPATVSLIACSSKLGNIAVATLDGFIFSTAKALRKTFYSADKSATISFDQDKISIPLLKPIRQIRFSAKEDQLVIAVEGSELLIFNIEDIKKGDATPAHTFNVGKEIIDLRPNPEDIPNVAAILFDDNTCKIIDITDGSTVCELPSSELTAICWSPKGKQIVCGKLDGSLQHFDTKGASKDALPIPEAMSAGNGDEKENRRVQDVLWIENHVFLVLYARQPEDEDDVYVNDGYIINRKPVGDSEPQYTRLAEITPIFTTEGRGNHFYMETIRGLGKEIKHLVIIANAATNELSVVGEDEDGQWATWQLPENGIASLPLTEETSMDTYPLGLCLDFSSDEPLPPFDSSDNEKSVDPVPIFYYVNDEGHIGAYHCYNVELARRGESYKGATTETKSSAVAAPVTAPVSQNTPSASSTFSTFGTPTNTSNNSSFADLLSGKNTTSPPATQTSSFGSFGSFGSSNSIPSFSNLGSAGKISTPSFGSLSFNTPTSNATSNASASAFGSTSSLGGGFSSLAKNTTTTTSAPVPTFGATSSVGSGFGSSAKTTTTTTTATAPTASAFGSTSTLGGGFGSLAKNTTTTTSAPVSTFGATSSVGSGFGSSAKTTTTTTTATAPTASAFGSTSTLGGGFGSLAKNTTTTTTTKPTTSTAPTTSAFGSTSTLGGGFGSLSKPTTTAAPTTSAFGSTSTLGGGFGSLAKTTATTTTTKPTTSTAPTTSAFGSTSTLGGGFGSLSKPTTTATTTTTTTTTAAPTSFGTTSTLGGGFGSLGKTSTTTPSFGSTTSIGGGFSSLAKTTVPGAMTPKTTFGTSGFGTTSTAEKKTDTTTKTLLPEDSKSSAPTFGSLAKTTVPETTAPKATFSFGSATKTTTETKPTDTTIKPVTAPVATAPTTTPKPIVKSEPTKEKIKPTATEGMAKQFEAIYITVNEELDQLTSFGENVSLLMDKNKKSLETKTESNLQNSGLAWNLNDVAQLGVVADNLVAKINTDQSNIVSLKEKVETYVQNGEKLMQKQLNIEYLLNKEVDSKVVDILDNRELDKETKSSLYALESKFEAVDNVLEDLELKVQTKYSRNKIQNDHDTGMLTLYSLHRSIRDIERGIVSKNSQVAELEERLANIKLNDSKYKAKQSARGFSCDDFSDSEDEEDNKIRPEVIEHTTRYIRRYNFLDTVVNETSKRAPLKVTESQ